MRLQRPPCWPTPSPMLPCPSWWMRPQRGTERQPLAFFSKTFSPMEHRYSTFGRELLAAYFAAQYFKPYAEGSRVVVYTDHLPVHGARDSATRFPISIRPRVPRAPRTRWRTLSPESLSTVSVSPKVSITRRWHRPRSTRTYPVPSYHRPVPVFPFLPRYLLCSATNQQVSLVPSFLRRFVARYLRRSTA